MTVTSAPAPRSFAFGSVDPAIWGAAWLSAEDKPSHIALASPTGGTTLAAGIEGHSAEEPWRITGDGVELLLTPLGEPSDHRQEGFDQLGHVEGRFTLEGQQHAVSCLGWRAAAREDAVDDRVGSFRQVAAWFEPAEGLALLALRPRSARGQEADVLTAAVLDPETSIEVADPRLSTTYSSDGQPSRAGIELWVGDEEQQYPRRAAGEALGQPLAWRVGRLEVHAQLFSWHSRGANGAGIYLIGTAR